MRDRINISVKSKCGENYESFKRTSFGGYCDNCKKEVIDFSGYANSDIYRFFNDQTGKICGKFKPNQLRTIAQPRTNSALTKLIAGCLSAVLSLISIDKISALHRSNLDNTIIFIESESVKGCKSKADSNKSKTVSGTVTDAHDKSTVPGAIINLKGSNIGTETDIKGRFSLEIPEKQYLPAVLIVSFVGYETKEVELSKLSHGPITLEVDVAVLGDVCYKRPFPSNVWHWLTKPFRK